MSEQTAELITQLVAAWNSRDPERVTHLVLRGLLRPGRGHRPAPNQTGGVRRIFEAYYRAFPDLEITPDDIIVAGNHVALF